MRFRHGTTRHALVGRRSLRWAVVVALSLVTVACKRPPSVPPTSDPTEVPPASEGPPRATEASDPDPPPDAVEPKPACAARGTLWDGKPGQCLYVHEGCCYPDPASLCAAAGCADEACRIVESQPAAARCPEAASPSES